MNLNIRNTLTGLMVGLVLGVQQLKAQQENVTDKVEYLEATTDDLNSIQVPATKVKSKKNIASKHSEAVLSIQQSIKKRKKLRFRNKRESQTKCYRQTDSCKTDLEETADNLNSIQVPYEDKK